MSDTSRTVRLSIDGREVVVPEGATVRELHDLRTHTVTGTCDADCVKPHLAWVLPERGE